MPRHCGGTQGGELAPRSEESRNTLMMLTPIPHGRPWEELHEVRVSFEISAKALES